MMEEKSTDDFIFHVYRYGDASTLIYLSFDKFLFVSTSIDYIQSACFRRTQKKFIGSYGTEIISRGARDTSQSVRCLPGSGSRCHTLQGCAGGKLITIIDCKASLFFKSHICANVMLKVAVL